MDKQKIKGAAKKSTGTIKETAGQLIGSRHTEMRGKAEKAEGHVRTAIGRAKDAARSALGKK